MAGNNLSDLDADQVIRSVYDEPSNSLKTTATISGGGGLEVVISHTDDSIRLGDGTNLLTSTNVGPKYGQDVAVISSVLPSGAATETTLGSVLTELQQKTEPSDAQNIRNLVFTTDKVDTSGSTVTVSGTVTVVQPTGTNLHTVIDSGTITTITNVVHVDDNGGSLTVDGPLTDAQLRATPVPVSGTVTVTPSGTQDINLIQVGGNTITTGSGASATGTQRVILATDQPVIPISDNGGSITVDGTIAATQSGTWNVNNVSGTVSLPTGASTSALQTTGNSSLSSIDSKTPALGQALAAASVPVVLTAAQITTLTPLTSITVTQATGTNLHTVVDSGTVTANAGTNLNTSLLALESGGNLATVKTNTDNLSLSQASSTSGQKGNLILSATTTAAPTYTTATSNPLSTTTAGALRTDSSATTQPISGTVSVSGSVAVTGPLTDTQLRATAVPVSLTSTTITGTVAATQSGTWTVQPGNTANTTPWLSTISQGGNSASVSASNALKVDGSAVTQPVSGTVAATQSGTWSTRTQDGSGNNITSQVSGAQRALDVGINVAGVQVDPRSPLPGTVTHTSATATNASSTALASNSSRKYLLIQNTGTQTIWLSIGGTATAAAPSIQLTAGSTFTMESGYVSTQTITSIRGGGSNQTFSIVEGT